MSLAKHKWTQNKAQSWLSSKQLLSKQIKQEKSYPYSDFCLTWKISKMQLSFGKKMYQNRSVVCLAHPVVSFHPHVHLIFRHGRPQIVLLEQLSIGRMGCLRGWWVPADTNHHLTIRLIGQIHLLLPWILESQSCQTGIELITCDDSHLKLSDGQRNWVVESLEQEWVKKLCGMFQS